MTWLAVVLALMTQAGEPRPLVFGEPQLGVYIITGPTPLLAAPKRGSKPVTTLQPGDFLIPGKEGIFPDALCGMVGTGNGLEGCLTNPRREQFVSEDFYETSLKSMRMRQLGWARSLQADVLLRRVRIGFIPEQVELSIGMPLLRESEETATGSKAVWTYVDRVIAFAAGRVSAIKQVEIAPVGPRR